MSKKCLWGRKIFEGTMKHIFQKHFVFNSHDHGWSLNPDDPEKVQKRVIPTIRMVSSWIKKLGDMMSTWTDERVVHNFLTYIRFCHNDVWVTKHPKCELCDELSGEDY